MEEKPRFAYLDHLRSLVIVLVVIMHSNVTYSGMGGWFYKEGNADTLDPLSKVLFGFYGSFTQAWFLGTLFFISAFLSSRSLERKGPGRFATDRLARLGFPLLLYVAIVHPLTVYFFAANGTLPHQLGLLDFAVKYFSQLYFVGGTGPLWFVEALLVFDLLFALKRQLWPIASGSRPTPGLGLLILVIGVTAAAAFVLRLYWPIGTDVLNLQFGFFASYMALYWLGLKAGREGWFTSLKDTGRRWLWTALGAGVPAWLILVVAAGALTGDPHLFGGFYWQTAAYAVWESFIAVAMTLGTVAFFQTYLNRSNAFFDLVNRNSFRVYMFHPPVLLAISFAMMGVNWAMLAKHAVVAPLAVAGTLGVAWALSLVPGLRRITA